MALVVLCGLVSLAGLSLFVLPTLYLRFAPGQDLPAIFEEEDSALPVLAGSDDGREAVLR
jgi:hypothetical protein